MHYYKRHLGDYAAKAGHLSPLEHGVYNLILDAYYGKELAPTKAEAIRHARARTDAELAAVDAVLSEFFTERDGRFYQSRVEDELSAYRKKAEANSRIAKDRESAKKARNVHETCTTESPDVHETCGSGEPNHKPLTNNQEEDQNNSAVGAGLCGRGRSITVAQLQAIGVSKQVATEYLQLRKQKRSSLTPLALDGLRREAESAMITLDSALRTCIERGWVGFKAEWLQGNQRAGPSYQQQRDEERKRTIEGLTGVSNDTRIIDITPERP